MSAAEGSREPPKAKGKTLGGFFSSLPGFGSARNLLANAHSSAREARPREDPAGTKPQAQGATELGPTAKGTEKPPTDEVTSGVANAVDAAKGAVQGGLGTACSAITGTKEALSTGVLGAVGVAKGIVQGGLDTTKTALTGTKDTVSAGLTGAMNMAKGTVQGGLDTSKAVLTGTKDTVSAGLTGAMNVAKSTVQTGVDTSKAVLTGTKDTVSAGLTGAMNVAKGTVQTGFDTSKAVLTGTKDTMSAGLTGAVNMAKSTVQTGVDTSKAVLTGTKDTVSAGLTGAMNVAKGTVQTGFDTSKAVLTGTKDTVSAGLTGAMNVAKGTVQTGVDTSKAVLTGTKSALCSGVTGIEGAVQGGLDTLKSVLPGPRDAVSAGLPGAIQRGLTTTHSILAGTKDAVRSGATGAMNVATGAAVSSGLTGAGDVLGAAHALPPAPEDAAWGSDRASTSGRGPAALSPRDALAAGQEATPVGEDAAPDVAAPGGAWAGQSEVATGFSELRDELERLGEIFRPMTAEEQARLAASQPEPTVLSADRGSYFVRLGDLAPAFRQRAFEHALSHLQHGQFQARAALARLQESFRLIEETQASGQPALDQGTGATEDTGPPQGPDAGGALAQARGLLQQLHRAYSGLASGLQGLPPELQQLLVRARHSLCDLYGVVAAAGCARELPAERLAQSRAAVSQAWQGLERRLEGLQHGPPLGWLVGPFALLPRGQQL